VLGRHAQSIGMSATVVFLSKIGMLYLEGHGKLGRQNYIHFLMNTALILEEKLFACQTAAYAASIRKLSDARRSIPNLKWLQG
jgi:hypothetical protein